MTDLALDRRIERRGWPMTSDAHRRLTDELADLRREATLLAGTMSDDGVVHLSAAQAARRLETLSAVLENASLDDQPGVPAIGRSATLRDAQGGTTTYAIVFPGDGDPSQGWVSADSPLGAAILAATLGEAIEVQAPSGPWSATVVAIE